MKQRLESWVCLVEPALYQMFSLMDFKISFTMYYHGIGSKVREVQLLQGLFIHENMRPMLANWNVHVPSAFKCCISVMLRHAC